MSKATFTKGPWFLEEGVIAAGAQRKIVCGQVRGDTADEAVANASLIAAAPDMYAALEAAWALMEFKNLTKTGNYQTVCDALAKARGES